MTGKVADQQRKHRQPSVVLSFRHAGGVVLSAAYATCGIRHVGGIGQCHGRHPADAAAEQAHAVAGVLQKHMTTSLQAPMLRPAGLLPASFDSVMSMHAALDTSGHVYMTTP